MPTRKKFLLRINSDLWDELDRWAGDELRSVNSQIEYLLRQAVHQRGRRLAEPPDDVRRTDDAPNSHGNENPEIEEGASPEIGGRSGGKEVQRGRH